MKKNLVSILFFLIVLMIPVLFCACGKKQDRLPDRGTVSLQSVPSGASIFLGQRPQGKTPLEGRLPAGDYVLRLSKPGWQSAYTVFTVKNGEKTTVNLALTPETAEVLLKSIPSGAAILFNGKNVGVTPLVLRGLKPGSYKAVLKAPGFALKEIEWNVSNARPTSVFTELSSSIGTMRITSSPSDATVRINGDHAGKTPLTIRQEQGEYRISIQKNGYYPYETTIAVNTEKTTEVQGTLSMIPGAIQISSRPRGASVSINGKDYGVTPAALKSLTPGTYAIKVWKDGYDSAERTVNLAAGQKLDLDFGLDSNTGGIDIITYPPGVTLYLNGKMAGSTVPDPAQPEISKVFQIRNLAVGDYELIVAHKRARPNRRVYKVKVEKGKIERMNNVSMWVANAVVTMKNGRIEKGRLVAEQGKDKIIFQPEPGITYTYKRNEIVSIEKIREKEE